MRSPARIGTVPRRGWARLARIGTSPFSVRGRGCGCYQPILQDWLVGQGWWGSRGGAECWGPTGATGALSKNRLRLPTRRTRGCAASGVPTPLNRIFASSRTAPPMAKAAGTSGRASLGLGVARASSGPDQRLIGFLRNPISLSSDQVPRAPFLPRTTARTPLF